MSSTQFAPVELLAASAAWRKRLLIVRPSPGKAAIVFTIG
jgi:hypothetical protein